MRESKVSKIITDVGVSMLFILSLLIVVIGSIRLYDNSMKQVRVCDRMSVDSPDYEKLCGVDFKSYSSFVGD
jgi:hypothetical protein